MAFAITTLPISGITNTGAISGGKVTNENSETIQQVGIQIQKGIETGRTTIVGSYGGLNVPFIIPITGLLPNIGYTIVAFASGTTLHTTTGVDFTTAPNPPEIGSITQPIRTNETGSVRFINIPDGADTIIWSGTTTGTTTTAGGTSFTVTGLTVGTYFFKIKGDFPSQPFSPLTTVVIAVPTVTELSATGYKLYERTGIGDGAAEIAFDAIIAVIDRQIFVETNYTPEEIVLENIK